MDLIENDENSSKWNLNTCEVESSELDTVCSERLKIFF